MRRKRSALAITDTELKLMAAAAIMGESSRPKTGYSTPAQLGVVLFRRDGAGFQRHAAFGAGARPLLPHLRMHGAGINPRSRRCRGRALLQARPAMQL